jgi:hypothetical protein
MSTSQIGNPDSDDQDAQPPGNGITTPLDAERPSDEEDDPNQDDAVADPPD